MVKICVGAGTSSLPVTASGSSTRANWAREVDNHPTSPYTLRDIDYYVCLDIEIALMLLTPSPPTPELLIYIYTHLVVYLL